MNSLVSEIFTENDDTEFEVIIAPQVNDTKVLPIDKLMQNDRNRKINEEHVKELASSIKLIGLLQFPCVYPLQNGTYLILAGHHRIEACRQLQIESIRCKVCTSLDDESQELALIDTNIESLPLTTYEMMMAIGRKEELLQAKRFKGILNETGSIRDIIATQSRMLKSTQVGKYLRIYKSGSDSLHLALQRGEVTLEKAYVIAALPIDQQAQALQMKTTPMKEPNIFNIDVENYIQHRLGTKVAIKEHCISINFIDTSDLNRILEILDLLED